MIRRGRSASVIVSSAYWFDNGRVELEASGGANPDRLHAREPVVVHEMVGVGGPGGEVADEVEHLLAGRRDDGRDGDLAHERAIVPAAGRSQIGALGGAGDHGEPALARVHALGAHRAAPVLGQAREAEVAEHAPAVELVHALAGERSATAVGARGVGLGERADAAAHEHGGEVGHGTLFACSRESC